MCVPSHRWDMYLMGAAPRIQDAEASASAVALPLALAMTVRHGGEGVWAGRGPIEWRAPVLPPLITWKSAALELVEAGVKMFLEPQMPGEGETTGVGGTQALSNLLGDRIQERRKER